MKIQFFFIIFQQLIERKQRRGSRRGEERCGKYEEDVGKRRGGRGM